MTEILPEVNWRMSLQVFQRLFFRAATVFSMMSQSNILISAIFALWLK